MQSISGTFITIVVKEVGTCFADLFVMDSFCCGSVREKELLAKIEDFTRRHDPHKANAAFLIIERFEAYEPSWLLCSTGGWHADASGGDLHNVCVAFALLGFLFCVEWRQVRSSISCSQCSTMRTQRRCF